MLRPLHFVVHSPQSPIVTSEKGEPMSTLRATTLAGTDIQLDSAAVTAFKARLHRALVCPEDPPYEQARKVWNGMIDKHPALIARCTGVADVLHTVQFARTHEIPIAMRCASHNAAGHATCDGGIVADLTPMKGMRVDAPQRRVHAQWGVLWGEFDSETQVYGLGTTGGAVNDTGIAGLTLGGGIGWLMSQYGLACDNLVSADVVTAEGEVITASATEHPDLFWALRGGGGNFGVVTSFEYQPHPVGPVLAGLVLYSFTKAKEPPTLYIDFATAIPDEVNTIGGLLTSSDGAPVAVIAVCYHGNIEAGERLLRPLRTFGPP